MKTIEVEALGEASNAAVLKLPYRQFPGVLIQGDSLSILASLADSIEENIAGGETTEARAQLSELRSLLHGYRAAYESAMHAAGLSLPYFRR